jgi:hypothetical protein
MGPGKDNETPEAAMVLTVTGTGARRSRLQGTNVSTDPRFARGLLVAFLIMLPIWLAVGVALVIVLG